MEQKKIEPIRDARKLGKAKMLILGIQHMFAMLAQLFLYLFWYQDIFRLPAVRSLPEVCLYQ